MNCRFAHLITSVLIISIAGTCLLASADDKQQVIEVPFDFYRNEIIVHVKVNGKGPFNMMLDTGTDPSAIDIATAKELGLKLDPIAGKAAGGGTSTTLFYETKLPLVELGDVTAKNLDAGAIDLRKISERLKQPLHGVLGHSLLNGRIVQIDYPNRRLRFYSRPLFSKTDIQSNSSKRTTLSFQYHDNVIIDDVFVNGRKMLGSLDTGSDGTFKLTPAAVSLLGMDDEVSRAPVSESVGYNDLSVNRKGTVDKVIIGGITIEKPSVIFFGKGTGRDKKPWGVNIGNEFLKDFVVTIDYRSKLIRFERP